MNTYFVTGLHRAGTHSFAEYIAREKDCEYIPEDKFNLYDFAKVLEAAKDNTVIHCPFFAHKVLELAELGKVYWVTRNKLDVITSMRNVSLKAIAWKVMNDFKSQFPDDEIWPTLTYNGEEDACYKFVQYYELVINTKMYFYNKYFKDIAELIETEKQPYYDYSKTVTSYKPLKHGESIRLHTI